MRVQVGRVDHDRRSTVVDLEPAGPGEDPQVAVRLSFSREMYEDQELSFEIGQFFTLSLQGLDQDGNRYGEEISF
jgi:hypothetical protein